MHVKEDMSKGKKPSKDFSIVKSKGHRHHVSARRLSHQDPYCGVSDIPAVSGGDVNTNFPLGLSNNECLMEKPLDPKAERSADASVSLTFA